MLRVTRKCFIFVFQTFWSMFFICTASQRFSMEERGNKIQVESHFNQRDAFRESWSFHLNRLVQFSESVFICLIGIVKRVHLLSCQNYIISLCMVLNFLYLKLLFCGIKSTKAHTDVNRMVTSAYSLTRQREQDVPFFCLLIVRNKWLQLHLY